MPSLVVNRVRYSGEKYFYESPVLTNGLNVLSAENGHGKTTFSSLIYFCLGGNPRFFKDNVSEKHIEIVEDKNNFAELEVTIGNDKFNIRRFIGYNDIIIRKNGSDEVEILPVFKVGSSELFSHWISKKLKNQF